MEAQTIQQTGMKSIVIIDAFALRRAEIECFLAPWAETSGLTINAIGSSAELSSDMFSNCGLLVLNLGSMPCADADFIRGAEELRHAAPDVPIVIFSDREAADDVVTAFRLGARGFIPNTVAPHVALQALTFILAGGNFFPPAALLEPASSMMEGRARSQTSEVVAPASSHTLTVRQQEVLLLLRQGMPNKSIARQLSMQEATVKVHVRQIMRKFGVSNRTQAALISGAHVELDIEHGQQFEGRVTAQQVTRHLVFTPSTVANASTNGVEQQGDPVGLCTSSVFSGDQSVRKSAKAVEHFLGTGILSMALLLC